MLTASVPHSLASTPRTFPSQTQAFVDDLLTDYNSFIGLQWRDNQSGFAIMQRFFPLYAPPGQTFRVIVTWAGPRDNTSLNMMFIPTGGNTPVVVNDSTDYLANNPSPPSALNPCTQPNLSTTSSTSETTGQSNSYQVTVTMHVCEFAQVGVNLTGNYDYATNVAFNYNGSIANPALAIGVRVANITGDYAAFAQSEAIHLYYDDLNYGKSWLAANPTPTQTPPRTLECTSPSNWPTCAVNWLEGNPIVLLVVILFGGVYGALELAGKGLGHLVKHRHKEEPSKEGHEEEPKDKPDAPHRSVEPLL